MPGPMPLAPAPAQRRRRRPSRSARPTNRPAAAAAQPRPVSRTDTAGVRQALPDHFGVQFLKRGLPVAELLLGFAVFAQRLVPTVDRGAHRRGEPVALLRLGGLVRRAPGGSRRRRPRGCAPARPAPAQHPGTRRRAPPQWGRPSRPRAAGRAGRGRSRRGRGRLAPRPEPARSSAAWCRKAGASGTTSRRPLSASNATAVTWPASSGTAAARMSPQQARTLPPAARTTRPALGRHHPDRLAESGAVRGRRGEPPAGCAASALLRRGVDHIAAVGALSPGVQTDPVVAPRVGARLALRQAPPDQPPERIPQQGLAAGLLQSAGQPVGQQLRAVSGCISMPAGRPSSACVAFVTRRCCQRFSCRHSRAAGSSATRRRRSSGWGTRPGCWAFPPATVSRPPDSLVEARCPSCPSTGETSGFSPRGGPILAVGDAGPATAPLLSAAWSSRTHARSGRRPWRPRTA